MQLSDSVVASEIMSSPVRTIAATETIEAAQRLLWRYGHSGLCVVNSDRTLAGIISRRDVETSIRHGLGRSAVSDLMSRNPQSVQLEAPLTQIRRIMLTRDLGRVPVVSSGKVVGIVTRSDLLRGLSLPVESLLNAQSKPPSGEALCQRLEAKLPSAWPILMQLADVAESKGWSLYVVGGAVRDLLLSVLLDLDAAPSDFLSLTDIDVVVAGAEEGAGVALAETIRLQHSQVGLQIHGQFQTASLTWPTADGAPLVLDIATARTEFYPYPAANPEVEASSIHQDLYRRDFTINAMAIALSATPSTTFPKTPTEANKPVRGQLIDFFGGWLDLQKRQMKVLHSNSFIEDPTRIFRGVRFAARLDFALEPETSRLIEQAIRSGIYDSVRASQDKTPALQSRLTAELKYLFSEPAWEVALAEIARLGALSCIHKELRLTPALWRQLRRMNRWLIKFQSETFVDKFGIKAPFDVPPKWLMLLELMIAQLDSSGCEQVAATLNLGAPSQRRLQNLHTWEAHIIKQMPKVKKPSQLFSLLRSYEISELLLMSDRYPYTLGPQIWHYIVRLSDQPSLLTGRNLKQMGYQPGPQFRKILTDVDCLALDGELTSVQAAEAYVLDRYPQS